MSCRFHQFNSVYRIVVIDANKIRKIDLNARIIYTYVGQYGFVSDIWICAQLIHSIIHAIHLPYACIIHACIQYV